MVTRMSTFCERYVQATADDGKHRASLPTNENDSENCNRCRCRHRRPLSRHEHHDHQLRLVTNATNSPRLFHTLLHLKVRNGKFTFPSPEWDQVSYARLVDPAKCQQTLSHYTLPTAGRYHPTPRI